LNTDFRNALKCIRCGACMNTCPVYRRSGGHSYHSTIAGPIGSILAPGLNMKEHADLPFASTLCGSCSNVCPVKIDIHDQLYKWRQVLVRNGHVNPGKKLAIQVMSTGLSSPWIYRIGGKVFRMLMRTFPFVTNNRVNSWYQQREMPDAPKQSYLEWYKKNKTNG
jgi:L-lactate dehydrogenase complex protein LldF